MNNDELIETIAREYLPRDFVHQNGLDITGATKIVNKVRNHDREKVDRLVEHCACLGIALRDDYPDLANESWRALPDDIQELINKESERLDEVFGDD
jgi:hypothetical protein